MQSLRIFNFILPQPLTARGSAKNGLFYAHYKKIYVRPSEESCSLHLDKYRYQKTIFKKVRTETVLKLYNTLILPTFLYGSENWTMTASQRRRIEAAEMKLLRPLAGYTLYDHKTNNAIRKELRITNILDKIDEYRKKWLVHIQRMP